MVVLTHTKGKHKTLGVVDWYHPLPPTPLPPLLREGAGPSIAAIKQSEPLTACWVGCRLIATIDLSHQKGNIWFIVVFWPLRQV